MVFTVSFKLPLYHLNYRLNTILLIITATAVRCLIACFTELGNDEVYYRLYADPLQWNYFDHPPMVGWLIRLSTCNLFLDTAFTIRLGAIACGAWASWLMYKCGERLVNQHTGFLAVILYTANIYGSIIAGTFILPDSPQMVCWMGCLLLLIKITETKYLTQKTARQILWFGVLTGIGMLCKIHTAFLWIGFGLYLLLYCRDWLGHWSIYGAAAITILLFTPVLLWNVQNDFVTYTYHSKRVDVATGGFNIDSLISFAGGQILYCNPVVFFLIARAVWHRDLFVKTTHKRLLLLTGIPLIAIATTISIFKDLLPHWTGPGFASLILLTAAYFAKQQWVHSPSKKIPFSFRLALGLLMVVLVAGVALVNFFPGTFGNKSSSQRGDLDFTLDMYGWKKFSVSFDSIYHSTHLAGNKQRTVILADKWFPAAHIEYYAGRPLRIPTVVTGPLENIHQYYWLNQQRRWKADSLDVYIISPSNYIVNPQGISVLKNINPNRIDTIQQYRNKELARNFYVYYYEPGKYNFDTTP